MNILELRRCHWAWDQWLQQFSLELRLRRLGIPLDELAATGRTCVQTGRWESIDGGELKGGRRHLVAAERMPYAQVLGRPTLWQRLLSKRVTARSATDWKLVAYDEPPTSD